MEQQNNAVIVNNAKQGVVSIDWQETSGNSIVFKKAFFSYNGFDVSLKMQYDYDHNFSELRGKFTQEWEQHALKYRSRVKNSSAYEYYVPYNSVKAVIHNLVKSCNYSIQDARKEAVRQTKEDFSISHNAEGMGYYALAIIAKLSIQGIELGSDSVWGVECNGANDESEDIDSLAWDCIREAMSEAKNKIKKFQDALTPIAE